MAPFSIRVESSGGASRVSVAGAITETSDFKSVVPGLETQVVIDLGDVDRINSPGVGEWMNFVQGLGSAGRTVALERCSVPMVSHLNLIANFAGVATVRSVFAPYVCLACSREERTLVELVPGTAASLPPEVKCPACGKSMELDEIPETYLSFHK